MMRNVVDIRAAFAEQAQRREAGRDGRLPGNHPAAHADLQPTSFGSISSAWCRSSAACSAGQARSVHLSPGIGGCLPGLRGAEADHDIGGLARCAVSAGDAGDGGHPLGDEMKRLIIGMSGTSGQIYGIRMLEVLRAAGEVETHLVMTPNRRASPSRTRPIGSQRDVEALADVSYRPGDIGAAIASGSFPVAGMVVVPCSIKSLSAIAHSYTDELLSVRADVQLKEGRPVLLMVRETPLHVGHLELMVQAARIGCASFSRRHPPSIAVHAASTS